MYKFLKGLIVDRPIRMKWCNQCGNNASKFFHTLSNQCARVRTAYENL